MRVAFTFLLLFFCTIGFTQAPVFVGESATPRSSEPLNQQFNEYHVFRIDVSALNQYVKSEPGTRSFRLELGDPYNWDLEIAAHDLRTADYRIRVATEKGIEDLPVSENKTYRGLRAQTTNRVALTLDHEFIYGYVEAGDETYFIEPLYYFVPKAERDLFVVYPASKVVPVEGLTCGVLEMHEHTPKEGDLKGMRGVETGNCYRVELAIASDWLMFQHYGTVNAVENHNIGVINNVNTNYDNEFSDELNFYIVEQWVSTCSTCDPWTSSTNPNTLLNSFTDWGPSGFNTTHDLGELWTKRDLDDSVIGIAWLDGICTPDRYHVLEDFSTNSNFLRVLAAHEIGHNLDATHDPQGSPTIMAPAVNNTNTWSSQSVSEINATILQIDPPNGCLAVCPPPAPPTPAFTANLTTLCTGSFVTFFDESTNQPASWSWSMPGATPSTSTERSPTVVYNNAGVFNVTLTVTNSNGSTSLTKPGYIIVTPSGGTDFFFFEGFENGTGGWAVFNSDNGITWANTTVNGTRQGSKAMMIDNFNYNAIGQRDALISPTFSLFGRNNTTLEIEYAYARYNSTRRDSLIVYISTNNGASYTRIFAATENGSGNFATKSDMTTPFNPQNVNEWCFGTGGPNCLSLSLAAYSNQPNCKIKIENYNGHGNRMYIDNVRLLSNCEVAIPPVANFIGVPTSGCAPLQVNFQDQSTNVPLAWNWAFPGALPPASTLQNPVVLFPTPGVYSVTLTAINPAGTNTITKTNYITVNTGPTASFTYVKNGYTVTFTNTSSSNSVSYNWDFGDGTNSTQQNPPPHTYSNDGAYVVILTVTNPCGTSIFPQTILIQTPPVAGFSASPTTGCAPLTVQFTDQSSSNTTGWSWTFPGGNPGTSTQENPVVTYADPGTYSVTLVVTNSHGSDTVSHSNYISVDTPTAAGFTFVVQGDTATFTNTSSNANTYFWAFGDGGTSTQANPVHLFAQSGSYEVSLTAYGDCDTITVTQTVETTQVPVAEFSADVTNGCTPFIVHFSDESAHAPTSWSWTFEGGTPATSTEQNPVVEYLNPGTFDVTLIVTNSQGSDTIARPGYITVAEGSTAGFSYVVNGTLVEFTNSSSNADSYLWDFGDGNTSAATDPTHDFGADGEYTVLLIAENAECGPDTAGALIVIVTPPLAGFSANVTEGCVPLTVQFSDESSENATSWSWTFDGGDPATSADQNPFVEYLTPGVFGVTLTVSNAAGDDTYSQTGYITVLEDPAAGFTYVVNSGSSVDFTNTSTAATSYAWDFGDGETSAESDPQHSYPGDGVYTVQLIATNVCGSDTTELEIVIVTPPLAGFTADQTEGCAPLTVQFTDASSANATGWSWTFEGGSPASSTDQNPIVQYLTPGVYGVTLTVSNAAGQSTESFEDFMAIFEDPTAGFTYQVNSGSSVDFTNSSTSATSYAWDFGDGETSAESDPQHVYAGDGVYLVQLIATNACGSDTTDLEIEIVTPPVAGFTADQAEGCAPLTVQFTDASSSNTTGWSWTFEGGNPATSTDQNPLVEYLSPGVYGVTLTVSNGAGESTESVEDFISVFGVPSADFTSSVNGVTVDFTNGSTGATGYAWDFGDGNTSAENDPQHTFDTDGVYTVELIATNDCGADTITYDVVIVLGPTAGFTADQTEGCATLTVQFTDLSSSNAISWEWTFEGGTPSASTEQNPVVEYLTPGVYGVTLTASNTAGEDTETIASYITVLGGPTAGYDVALAGASATFTNTSSNATGYSWNFGDGNTSVESDPTHEYNEDGAYTVLLIAMNDCGADTITSEVVVITPPVAGFSANVTQGCSPLTVQFTDLSSSNATDWEWTFEGGTPSASTQQNPVIQYLQAGTFGVTLTVSNAAGADTENLAGYITVNPDPVAGFTFTVNADTVHFTNTSTDGTTYIWDFGDSSGSTMANPAPHVYAEDGVYHIHLTVMNPCGSSSITQTIVVATSAPLALFSANPVSGCSPLVVTFDNLSSSNAETYEWSFPGGNPSSSTEFEPVVEYTQPGIYDVTLTATNIYGSDSYSQTTYIEVLPPTMADFQIDIINGATVQFTNTSSNASSYSWSFGDGNFSTEENPGHTYQQVGPFMIQLVVNGPCGPDTMVQTLMINAVIPTASFTAEPVSGCAPLVVNFKDDSQGNPTQWNWSFPGGNPSSSTQNEVMVQYNSAGQYTVTLQVSNVAGSDVLMQSEMIDVFDVPTPAFTYDVQAGNVVVFSNTTSGGDSFSWNFGDGQTSEQNSPTHTFPVPGDYTVVLTATNECGSKSMEVTIVISSTSNPGIFEQFAVYPNPNDGRFIVRIVMRSEAGNEPVFLRLVNALGQVLVQQEHNLVNDELTVPVDQQQLAKGFYWIEIQTGGFSAGKKVVVE